jgi:hypothetical protein
MEICPTCTQPIETRLAALLIIFYRL